MAQNYKTSLTIQFGGGETGVDFAVEIDTREDGYNNGRSSFRPAEPGKPGDNAYFLVFLSEAYEITGHASAGAVNYQETRSIEYKETVTFIEGEASVSRPVESITARKWIGVNGGTITPDTGGKSLRANTSVKVSIAEITYTARARVYFLTPPLKSVVGENGQVAVLLEASLK